MKLQPWTNWGTDLTEAKGIYRYNTCKPICAAGNLAKTKVRVELSGVTTCGSQQRYSLLEYDPKKPNLAQATFEYDCEGIVTDVF